MTRVNSRLFLPAAATLTGLLWVIVGLQKYGWISDGRPQSGFFPILVGALLVVVGILAVLAEAKSEAPVFIKAHVHPILAAVSVVVFALLVGFFPALTIYVFSWVKWYERYAWKTTAIVTVVTIALVYGVFALWLKVPFPRGAIVELVLR